jgi:hypothetical protein
MPPWEGCRGVYGRRILTLAAPKCVYSWVGEAGADLERAAQRRIFLYSTTQSTEEYSSNRFEGSVRCGVEE